MGVHSNHHTSKPATAYNPVLSTKRFQQ